MKFRIQLCFFCLVFFLICAIHFSAQAQADNTITGFVTNSERRSLADLNIEVLDDTNRFIARSKTDGAGRYIFGRLTIGRYIVRVTTIGTSYEEQTKEVEIINNRIGAGTGGSSTTQQDFTLKQKRSQTGNATNNGVVFAQEIPKQAETLYEQALANFKNKKPEDGINNLVAAIQIFPTYFLALESLGLEYVNQKKYAEARDVLTKAVETNPRAGTALYALAYSHQQLKNHTEAFDAVKKALEINPTSVNSLFLSGVILKQLGKFEEAIQNLKKADKLAPSSIPDIHWQLSLIYTNNLKNYSAAADELELFLKAKPDFDEVPKVRELIKQLRAKAKV